jgi:heme exporter protein B
MISDILTIVQKDLRLDLRRLENFISLLFFSLIILLVFAFALPADKESHRLLAPGIYWVTFLLSGILALNKSFQLERENSVMEALLLAPVSRGAIFLGKMLGNLLFIFIVQLILIPLFSILFHTLTPVQYGEMLVLSVIVTTGFTALGTLLSGLTADLRFKEILLPILLFPLLVPLLLAAVTITRGILDSQGFGETADWLKLLIGFDLIYMIVAFLTFDFVMEL